MTSASRVRQAPSLTAREGEVLEAFLDDYRHEVVEMVTALTDEQARTARSVAHDAAR